MCSSAIAGSTTVVITQVYGGGGNASATYANDFVELFNKSSSPVSLSGWSIQYASSTGAFNGGANNINLPNVTLQPGQYFLAQGAGGATGAALPTADVTGTVNMSGTAGKVALANTTTALGTITLPNANVVDFVGYGSGASLAEGGTPATFSTDNTKSVTRTDRCSDSDNNGSDFAAAAVTPHNTASSLNPCSGGSTGFVRVETAANGSGVVVPDQSLVAGNSITVYAIQRDASSNFVANIAADSWSLLKSGAVANSDLVPSGDLKSATFTGHGAGTANIRASSGSLSSVDSGIITVTATSAAQVRVETAADGSGTVVPAQTVVAGHSVTMYAIRRDAYANFVDNVAATAWSLPTTTGDVAASDLIVAASGKSATFIGNGQGTATVRATSGALTAVDSGLLTITQLPPASVVISQVYGGGGNSGATYQNDFVELFNRTANPVSLNGWSVQYASSTGSFGSSTTVALPSVNIPAYTYFLISLNTNGTIGSALPTPDFANTTINMSATAGKVALANTATALGAITWPDSRIIDLVAYGASSPYEGNGPAPTLSATASAVRNSGGCSDTDNNSVDFATQTPNARNTSNSSSPCPPNPPTISSIANQAVDASTTVGPIAFTVNDAETAAASLAVTATSDNTTLLPNANITFGGGGIVRNITLNPVSGQTGAAKITVTVTDSDTMTASTSFYLFVGSGPQVGKVFFEDFNSYPDGVIGDPTTTLSFIGDTGGIWHNHSGTPYQLFCSNHAAQVSFILTNSEDINASFTNNVGAPTAFGPESGGVVYVGFKLTQTTLPTTGDYFMNLKDSTSSNFFCKVFATTTGAAAGKFRLGVSNKANNPPNATFPADLDLNTTYNVALRYKVGVASSTLWINPSSISDTSVTAVDVITPGTISSVALREPGSSSTPSPAGSQAIDDLGVSTSFSDVVTLVAAPPVITATRSASSITMTWPIANGAGFTLQSATAVNSQSWGAVPGVTTSGANYIVTVPFTPTPAFFRLKK